VQVDVGVEHRHGGGLEEEDELDPNLKTDIQQGANVT
jgi:hypothetical protein